MAKQKQKEIARSRQVVGSGSVARRARQVERSGTYRLLSQTPAGGGRGVIVGPHYENGQIYRAGDEVPSDRPLDVLFPGKFEVVKEAKNAPDRIAPEEEFSETFTPYDTQDTERNNPSPRFEPEEQDIEDEDEESDETPVHKSNFVRKDSKVIKNLNSERKKEREARQKGKKNRQSEE
jgi:hypothetical protein